MTWIAASDPLALLALQSTIGTPASEGAAVGTSVLDTPQVAAKLGEPVPVVFARRRNGQGGVLISPRATEAAFANDQTTNAVTAFYHLVLSEGQIGLIERRDIYQGQCRVGAYSQTYNRRAGTWDPGNFVVPVSGFDVPECPQYCGTVGTYPDISTLSYGITVPDGSDYWRQQVHAFIRNGMSVQRLFDNVYGPSDNICDLLRWALQRTGKVPESLIDLPAFTAASVFIERYGFTCNGEFRESTNVPDLIAQFARFFLLRETNTNGKKGLRAALPVTANGELITDPIVPVYAFTDDVIMPNTFEANWTPLADRLPFVVQIMWRQHPDGHDVDTVRTAEVRYAGQAPDGPYESHDLSLVCTSELHAVRAGAYVLSRRSRSNHSARLVARPQAHNKLISQGDVVRVRVRREAQNTSATYHDWLYQVERISKTLAGDVSYELSHFPVDAEGRSLITQDVLAAQPTGIVLPNNRTGPSCDLFGPDDLTLPADTGRTGTGFASVGVPGGGGGGGGGGSPGIDEPVVPEDPLDTPPAPLQVFPPGPLQPGVAVVMPENPCGDGPPPVFRWLQCNEVRGQDKRYFVIGTAEISVPGLICPLVGEYLCPTDPNWNPQIVDDIFQPLPPGREVQRLWDAAITRYGFVGPVGGWYDVDITLRVETLEEFIDYEGNLSTFDEVYAVDLDGSKTLIARGTNARIWVIKSRYRDNGGPWQQLADFSSLLP
jgi:hypothetical protein